MFKTMYGKGISFVIIFSLLLSGNVFVSPTKAFAAANLALGKSVTASTTESPSYPASYAVDGNASTRWASAYSDQQNFIIDLGSMQSVSSVVLKWEAAYATQFQIQTSLDNASWTTVYSNYSGTGGTNTINFASTNARYVKLYAFQRATAYGYSLYEFEIYGNPSNLALGKPVTASSVESASYPAANAVDGNSATRWSSAVADQQNFVVDLGAAQTVSSVILKWESAYASQYQIQTSTDNASWTTVYSDYSATGGTNTITFPATNARYVKLYAFQRATAYGYSLYEFEVYGSGTPAARIGVLDYIYSISGSKTVIGIHNREPNATPAVQTNAVTNITGRYPGLWSGDFLFSASDISNRWTMVYEAKKQWDNGAIVNIMMHVTPPTQADSGNWNGGVVSSLTNAQWTDLITNGGALNQAWKARLDNYAQYLQYLEDQNVTVLFRPFHEMNQGIFWWAGRPGANGTAALYRLTHDYLENTKGLSNLVWVWDMQDLDLNWSVYNPGNSYWDIFALDVYNPDGFTTAKYNAALGVAGNKPIAIGECDKLPTASQLLAQPRWTFAMSWAELTFSSNTNAQIQALYGASNVITRDELPDLH